MTSKEFTNALRGIANFYEAHPELPLPLVEELAVFVRDGEYVTAKKQFADFARAAAPVKKSIDAANYYNLSHDFGGVRLTFVARREYVCTRRVVDVRHVPEKVVPEQVIPAHDEEVVAWDCPDSLLAAAEEVRHES